MRSERADLGSLRANFGSRRIDKGSEKDDLGSGGLIQGLFKSKLANLRSKIS